VREECRVQSWITWQENKSGILKLILLPNLLERLNEEEETAETNGEVNISHENKIMVVWIYDGI